jgi:hypothetical protein
MRLWCLMRSGGKKTHRGRALRLKVAGAERMQVPNQSLLTCVTLTSAKSLSLCTVTAVYQNEFIYVRCGP